MDEMFEETNLMIFRFTERAQNTTKPCELIEMTSQTDEHTTLHENISLVSLALLVAVVAVAIADATTYSTVFVVLLSSGADSQRRCCN